MDTEQLSTQKQRTPRRAFSLIGASLLCVILGTVIGVLLLGFLKGLLEGLLLNVLGTGFRQFPSEKTWMWITSFVPLYCVGFPAGLLVLKTLPAQTCRPLKLRAGDFFLLLLVCVPLMYGGSIIGSLLASLLSSGEAENFLSDYVNDSNPLGIVVMVILAPFFEELLFRKQIIDRSIRYGEKTAIFFSALLFGLFHMNLYQLFYAFALGLVFGYVYVRTHRLRYSVLMHMALNFYGGVITPMITGLDTGQLSAYADAPEEEALELFLEVLPQIAGILFFSLLVLGLCIAGLVVLIVKLPKLTFLPAEEELPKGQRFRTVFCNPGAIACILLCAAASVKTLFL